MLAMMLIVLEKTWYTQNHGSVINGSTSTSLKTLSENYVMGCLALLLLTAFLQVPAFTSSLTALPCAAAIILGSRACYAGMRATWLILTKLIHVFLVFE